MKATRLEGIFFAVVLCVFSSTLIAGGWIFNNPYPASEHLKKIYYTSFSEQPKTLDPAKSYSLNEYEFIAQIYEPLLQYDYFSGSIQLEPLIATSLPKIQYYDKTGQELASQEDEAMVEHSIYTIHIKPGILYQPHPAFSKEEGGTYRYFPLPPNYLNEMGINQLADFLKTGTRELTVDDYIYQIKRLANPKINSPIYGVMSEHILGFAEFGKLLPATNGFIDLRRYPLEGLKKLDDYTFQIIIIGLYPQFLFWLEMPFFSPIPWEVDRFYSEPHMIDKNLSLGWYPVGTGPFMLVENNPNSRMVLNKNPNFRETYFPLTGSLKDRKSGYLKHEGERLPLIDQAVYTLEKESIPRWTKFLQGFYDASAINADSFDKAIQISSLGSATLTPDMQAKGMRLRQMMEPSIYYLGFNMLDPVVGGSSLKARYLRLAISIAINFDEDIAIFFNGRGKPAQGPIPPGIFGYHEGSKGVNSYVFMGNEKNLERRPIADAKALMIKAGFPNGIDPSTGDPLILHYDVNASGGPDDKAQLNWMQKQFSKIGIALDVRATQYNRFQEKIRNGNAQIFSWSWIGDYPDPENFLSLFYGPNAKVISGGENAANYQNKSYDNLFDVMKNRPNDAYRQALIDQMVELLRHDAPWVWGIHNESLVLSQQWISPVKKSSILVNTLKYVAIDVPLRNRLRFEWNQPIIWPLLVFILLMGLLLLPFVQAYRKKQREPAPRLLR